MTFMLVTEIIDYFPAISPKETVAGLLSKGFRHLVLDADIGIYDLAEEFDRDLQPYCYYYPNYYFSSEADALWAKLVL